MKSYMCTERVYANAAGDKLFAHGDVQASILIGTPGIPVGENTLAPFENKSKFFKLQNAEVEAPSKVGSVTKGHQPGEADTDAAKAKADALLAEQKQKEADAKAAQAKADAAKPGAKPDDKK